MVVCSLHFRDGAPSPEFPFPTELLGETSPREAGPVFRGSRQLHGGSFSLGSWANVEAKKHCSAIVDDVLDFVDEKIDLIEFAKENELKLVKEKEDRRKAAVSLFKDIKYSRLTKKSNSKSRKLKVTKQRFKKKTNIFKRTRRTFSLQCKFCTEKFTFTKALFYHVKIVHILPFMKKRTISEVTPEETARALDLLYPPNTARQLDSKKKYVCAVCKSVCDLYGLFVHMKTVHHGLLCQYCLKLFKKVRDLESHLAAVHRVPAHYYASSQQLAAISGDRLSAACGECSALLTVAQIERHVCRDARHYTCPQCARHAASDPRS